MSFDHGTAVQSFFWFEPEQNLLQFERVFYMLLSFCKLFQRARDT